jgi:hypothetical protein
MANANREQFKDHVLRKCGLPVIDLEIDDSQIDDAIDEALKYYHDYHFDGSERAYYNHKITAQDRTNGYITLPEDIHFVSKVMNLGNNSLTNNIFGARYQFALNDFFNITSGNMLYYDNTMRYISLISEMFSTSPGLSYNRHARILKLHMRWDENTKDDQYIAIECTRVLNPDVHTSIWNDRWLINYTTILVKKQIGWHLMKYNITLPGGVTYNGETIYNIAEQEKEKMETEMISAYSLPPWDVVG